MSAALDSFRAGLDPQARATVDALRATVASAHPELVEDFKWNAPSFRHGEDHKVTLGIERKGGVRLVLHRGAKPKDASDFRFRDDEGLFKWLAPDRGVAVFGDADEVEAKRAALQALVARWITETA